MQWQSASELEQLEHLGQSQLSSDLKQLEHLGQSQLSSDLKQVKHLVSIQLQSVGSLQMVWIGLLQKSQSFWDAF